MVIREAVPRDVDAMSRVLVASITELCEADHGDIAANIARWTANKSPDSIRAWLDEPAVHLFVAERDGEVVCVGAFSDQGEIVLNYVAPKARFAGVSKAMLAHLEGCMRARGIEDGRLTSTATAHAFYVGAGWRNTGEPQKRFGVEVYPMSKALHA